MTLQRYDVVVLGAGAAGMMCALQAGRRGRRVLLLEHGERVGRKILISGGGRCNFTNLHARAENFLSGNPHFAKSALARYGPREFIALVERHGIRYHEKTLGQLFCDGSSRQIVTMLEQECAQAGVEIRCGVALGAVRATGAIRATGAARNAATPAAAGVVSADAAAPARFVVETSSGEITCVALVVATGGLSIPKMGATGFGYDLARQFGIAVVEPLPGLVPLVLTPADRESWCDLAGISTEVVATATQTTAQAQAAAAGSPPRKKKQVQPHSQCGLDHAPGLDDAPSVDQKSARSARGQRGNGRGPAAPEFREALLVTHRGLSGPAVLQVSSFWRPGNENCGEVCFDLAPGREVLAPLLREHARRDAQAMLTALRGALPARLAERWVATRRAFDWTNAGIARMERELHAWTLRPEGSEGFAKAEVTVGGVDTGELDGRTMESLRVSGLYFIGEVVDVTGWLGGYNFQWAWASAVAAAHAV